MIHVVVADSSAVVRSVLKEIILKTKKLEWIGEAVSYSSLNSIIDELKPELIISKKSFFDSERITAIADYCHNVSIPTIVYYEKGDDHNYNSSNVKFVEQPEFINFSAQKMEEYAEYLEQLAYDIKRTTLFENHPASIVPSVNEDGTVVVPLKSVAKTYSENKFKAVLVGVSTGGPSALLELLKGIGKDFPLPILITQHIDSFFDKNLITWLCTETHVPVHLAENNIKPLAAHVYFAPSDVHLTLIPHPEDGFHIILNHEAPVNFLRPSVDKMFSSAASVFGKNCIAVILTGMGSDGAKECLHLKELGAYTITQDESSCVIYGMPKAAYELGGACEVLPLNLIAERLWNLTGKRV